MDVICIGDERDSSLRSIVKSTGGYVFCPVSLNNALKLCEVCCVFEIDDHKILNSKKKNFFFAVLCLGFLPPLLPFFLSSLNTSFPPSSTPRLFFFSEYLFFLCLAEEESEGARGEEHSIFFF